MYEMTNKMQSLVLKRMVFLLLTFPIISYLSGNILKTNTYQFVFQKYNDHVLQDIIQKAKSMSFSDNNDILNVKSAIDQIKKINQTNINKTKNLNGINIKNQNQQFSLTRQQQQHTRITQNSIQNKNLANLTPLQVNINLNELNWSALWLFGAFIFFLGAISFSIIIYKCYVSRKCCSCKQCLQEEQTLVNYLLAAGIHENIIQQVRQLPIPQVQPQNQVQQPNKVQQQIEMEKRQDIKEKLVQLYILIKHQNSVHDQNIVVQFNPFRQQNSINQINIIEQNQNQQQKENQNSNTIPKSQCQENKQQNKKNSSEKILPKRHKAQSNKIYVQSKLSKDDKLLEIAPYSKTESMMHLNQNNEQNIGNHEQNVE